MARYYTSRSYPSSDITLLKVNKSFNVCINGVSFKFDENEKILYVKDITGDKEKVSDVIPGSLFSYTISGNKLTSFDRMPDGMPCTDDRQFEIFRVG